MASHESSSALNRAQIYLRPMVYGGNDGIVTTFAIVAGFAGASAEGAVELGILAVLIFGFANLFADAVSMGLGEFLSGRSQRGLYRTLRRQALAEIADNPAATERDLASLLRGHGLPAPVASQAAGLLRQSPELVVDLQLQHRHGVEAPSDVHPAATGLSTFISFVMLGVVPLLPFLLWPDHERLFAFSVVGTLCALALLGLLRGCTSGEGIVRAVTETVLVGSFCAFVAYLVGLLVAAA
ncbi:VIT1/CCC1 transporter family protein [Pseudoruegeria sp. HB172150]|uniref:VIT1/CCC1 transporter family protein n=1 Tax=Pseudoruegeria sp. HB172150 TaxID=2721164 RepID=UPI001555394A|nr:VIT1/CCC1 transporter family protein [Pseudoruegeria sp. HB172150]